jgi:type II secretion system protein N
MKRAILFLASLLLFVALTFPHELLVKRVLAAKLPPDVSVSFESVRPSLLPLGYRLDEVVVVDPPFRLAVHKLRAGLGLWGGFVVKADLCEGALHAQVVRSAAVPGPAARDVSLRFDGIDPGECLELDGPTISGTFTGTLDLFGVGRGAETPSLGRLASSGHFSLAGHGGMISGYLPTPRQQRPSGKQREPQPIGQWEFARLDLEGELSGDRIIVTRGQAEAEGVAWETSSATLFVSAATPRVQIEVRARRLDDSARSKAIMALLPKAAEKEGWRQYRINGALSSVQIAGVK